MGTGNGPFKSLSSLTPLDLFDEYWRNGIPLQIDKEKMAKDLDPDGWRGFLELCVEAKTTKNMGQLMDLFLTLEEKVALSHRFLIVRALVQGQLTQREIAEEHSVSIAQITRGSNALKIVDDSVLKLIRSSRSKKYGKK